MNISLLSLDFKLSLFLALIFIIIFPLMLQFFNKKYLHIPYLITYLIILSIGVLFDISIKHQRIKIGILITNKWFSNTPIIANFAPLGIIINLFLLFPLAMLLPVFLKKKTFQKVILIGILVSLFIEFLQFLLPIKRYPELLDILNNTIGVILGYICYLLTCKIKRGEKNGRISKQKTNIN